MQFVSWQNSGLRPGPPYNYESPNVRANLDYALAEFGGYNLGVYFVRPITGGSDWSTHAYAAANDWGYLIDRNDWRKGENRAMALAYINFLIANHEVLGVQMIVDEAYARTWKCSRPEFGGGPGWKSGVIKGGGSWLHIETHPDSWSNATPIAERIAPAPIPPTPTNPEEDTMRLIQPFGDVAVLIQADLECTWASNGNVVAALVAAGLVPAEVTVVDRIGLKGLVLVGPAPTDAAYVGARPDRPGRTKPSDFAAWRP